MPMIVYIEKKFSTRHGEIIRQANEIMDEYARQGYDLTLRQLYYQFVARDLLANRQQNYKMLGTVISAARCAGLIDWDRIVDRTRFLRSFNSWGGPAEIVDACADQFNVDFWGNQDHRPEVWIEKDALVGVLERACDEWRVPYFSCRGYTSDSDIWRSAQRMIRYRREGKEPVVFHLGDHDPSGINMTEDITARLKLFSRGAVTVKRLALNMDQVEEYEPPPNPAKETDSRFTAYQQEYGDESWELDALDPNALSELIATEMREIIDADRWAESEAERDEGRRRLRLIADNFEAAVEAVEGDEHGD